MLFKIVSITRNTSEVHEYSEVTQMIDTLNDNCTCENKENRDLVFSFLQLRHFFASVQQI